MPIQEYEDRSMQNQIGFLQRNISATQEQGIHCKRGFILSISKVSRVCMIILKSRKQATIGP